MKSLRILITILYTSIHVSNFGQGIIIDHTCTDIDAIPKAFIEDVKANIKWHYAHTSHGHSLTCGLESIENTNPLFNFELEFSSLPSVDSALCIYDGNFGYSYVLPLGYYKTEWGMYLTKSTLTNNPEIVVSAFCWCSDMNTFTPNDVQQYFDSLNVLENLFPNVKFVYFTGNGQYNGDYGYTRHINNNMIRQYCEANNKILFDFADLDCWYNDEMNYYIHNGDTIPLEHQAYSGDSCGHVNELSNIMKGNAVWWMMARLRGWNPDTLKVNLQVMLEGPFNGSSMNTSLSTSSYFPLSQPFNTEPWYYTGNENISVVPVNVVDWILLEVRDTTSAGLATSSTQIDRKAALLLSNGTVISSDEKSDIEFNVSIKNDLFVVVRHRNHLGILSASSLTILDGKYVIDFSTSVDQVFGSINSQKELSPGIWGMIAGDANANGTIEMEDKNSSWRPESGNEGYYSSDLNFDGQINNLDKDNLLLDNLNYSSQIPE